MNESGTRTTADDVIIRVVQETHDRHGRGVYRTALVKLIYLIDYAYAQHAGRTLTGFEYVWDNHGPDATGNAIVKRADLLQSEREAIQIDKGTTPSGNPKYTYRPSSSGERLALNDDLGERIIQDVIMTFGNLNWAAIVKAAKSTRPILQGKPGVSLNLSPDPVRQQRLAQAQETLGSKEYSSSQPGLRIGEAKARYGLGER